MDPDVDLAHELDRIRTLGIAAFEAPIS